MAKQNDLPATQGQSAAGATPEQVVTNTHEVTSRALNVPQEVSDGSAGSDGVVLEGLGDINAPAEVIEDDPTGGSGEYVVVLHEVVTGVLNSYIKGMVRRISNFIPAYGIAGREGEARASAKRLFDKGSIRLATSEEKGRDTIEVGDEGIEIRRERMRRIAAEQQLETLRRRNDGQGTITPSTLETNPNADPNGLAADWK